MASKTCPACGKEADGRFCSWCGASLGGVHCSSCGAEGEPGGRFCNVCGARLGGVAEAPARENGRESATPRGPSSRAVWWMAGGLVLVVVLAVTVPLLRQASGDAEPAAPAGPPATGQAMTDLSSMTPRQAADQLYERIMRTAEAGDSASVAFFLPMGLQAYERARPLDADGLFHLSLLRRMSGDAEGALAAAEEALAVHPNHLLNLAAAGAAAAEGGDTAAAAGHYGSFLEAYDGERAKGLPEYEMHAGMMPELRREARAFADGGGGP